MKIKNKLVHVFLFVLLLGAIVVAAPPPPSGRTLQLNFNTDERALMTSRNFSLVSYSEMRCDTIAAGTCEADLIYTERGITRRQLLVFPHGAGLSTNSNNALEDLRDERIRAYVSIRLTQWREEDIRQAQLDAIDDERRGNTPVGPGAITIR